MAFNIREGYWGLEHLRLALCRKLFNMKPEHYISRYAETGTRLAFPENERSDARVCERCGFVIMRAELEGGWLIEMCSALPLVSLKNRGFQNWFSELAVKNKTESAAGRKILHTTNKAQANKSHTSKQD